MKDGAFAGGAFDLATPFALLCGLGVVAGYALLGACWLVMKTDGEVAERARGHAKLMLLAVLAFMAAVSLWTPLAFPRIAARWFSTPNIYYLWPVPIVTALTAFALWRWLEAGREVPPFFAAIALFLLGYLGLVISVFPYLVPPTLTIWDTAAAPASQRFMLIGHAHPAADHHRLFRVRVLDVPRQGARGRRLSSLTALLACRLRLGRLYIAGALRSQRRLRPDHAPSR